MAVHGEECRELNITRSNLLRLYHPRESVQPLDQVELLKNFIVDAKNESCNSFTTQFLNQAASLFGDLTPAEAHGELNEIMSKAIELSTKLGTQRSGLRCEGQSDLPAIFDHKSNIMEAHSLHNKDLADDDAALDGRPIVLVTLPAIVAIGKSDGSDYKTRRILGKAVVLVG
jgi:hypothetical protein